jgi:hypothetical protein
MNDANQLEGKAAPWSEHACSGERPSRLWRDEASSSHPRWEDGLGALLLGEVRRPPGALVFGLCTNVSLLSASLKE